MHSGLVDELLKQDDHVSSPLQGTNKYTSAYATISPAETPTKPAKSAVVKRYEPSGFRQLTATIQRQFLQKFRMPVSMLLEVLLPIVFVLGLVAGNAAGGTDEKPGANFLRPASPTLGVQPITSYTPLANNPAPQIKQRFCYNGTRMNESEAASVVYGGNCNDGRLACSQGVGAQCAGLPMLCTDSFSSYKLPPGFCFYAESIGYIYSMQMGNGPNFVYDFDSMVLLQWIGLIFNEGPATDPFNVKILQMSGPLHFSPKTQATQSLVQLLNNSLPLFRFVMGRIFDTSDEAVALLTSTEGEGQWGLVDVYDVSPTALAVSLRLNRSATPFTSSVTARFSGGLASTRFRDYMNSGFVTLQSTISEVYLRQMLQATSNPIAQRLLLSGVQPSIVVAPMGYAPYKSSVFLQIAGSALAPLVLVLSFLYTVSQISKRLVEEKELRLREGTMVMGLGKLAFYFSWIFTYVVQVFVSTVLITVVVKAGLNKQSDPVLIFVLYFLFGVSTILLAALLSSFFSKSRITALVVPLIYFGLSIPSFSLPEGTSRGTFSALSLFSPTAFGIGTRLIFSYEVNNGMGWGDITNSEDVINMGGVFGLLIFDCILYLLLMLYLDAVLPSEWGSRLHPCFCCCCCCASKNNGDVADVSASLTSKRPIPSAGRSADAMEEYPNGGQGCTMHLQKLRKEFTVDDNVKVAVNDLDLKIFPDHITVILGHNGAGKTTTMNMVTGMLPISSGDCIVYGKSARHELREVRKEIGYCPQHNILWDNLTCAEHLRYFARLKGVPSKDEEQEVDEMLQKVDLLDKKDVFSSMLSGGQKRKLSVAIAFIGGSRLILLDEPTAGMDVAARRHTWDLLNEMSAGRTIILTTHFMDEADLLGSRIAIMSAGSLHSYGSPMYLKSNLGTGYVMRLSVGATNHTASPLAGNNKKFPHDTQNLNPSEVVANNLLKIVTSIVPDACIKEVKGQEIAYSLPMNRASCFGQLVRTLEDKHLQQQHNILGISMSVSTLEDVFVRIAEEEEHLSAAQASPAATPTHADMSNHNVVTLLNDVYQRFDERPCAVSLSRQFSGLLLKRFHNARRDRRTIVLQVILPTLCILIAMGLSKLGPPGSPQLWLNGNMYKNPQQIPITGAVCQQAAGLMSKFDAFSTPLTIPAQPGVNQSYNFSSTLVDQFKQHGGVERMISFSCEDPGFATNASMVGGYRVEFPSATVALFNASGVHTLPQSIAAFYNGIAGLVANATVSFATHPLPFSARQSATISGIQNLIAGIFILIPFTFIPSTYVAFVVKERSSKAKHLQMVSGVNYLAYWAANFVFDLVSFFVTEILALIIFAIFARTEYIGSEAIGATILLFVLYGLSGISSAYLFSFLFENHGSAQNITMLANFLAGFALVITMYILEMIPSTESAAKVIVFFCRVVPAYCLGEGILALASNLVTNQLGGSVNIWDMNELGWDFLFMSVEVLIFSGATLLIDHPKRQMKKQQLLFDANAEAPPVDNEDPDVKSERREVESQAPHRQTDVVAVKKLRKVYPNGKVAVVNISFGVKQGEVFGFLGTNGAGKTTTMSILTSEFLPSMGHCAVGGYDVVEHAAESQRIMGFCPQFDALLDLLTCEEHLYLYAALRGVAVSDTAAIVNALLEVCGIDKYRAIPSKKLSGGNKRKLSVAISLIGAPKLVLLDEPSAGMDPQARRMMWDVISYVARRSSVVLTTHHLEEVDVLAHRVAIMVDGTIRCLGSLDHLKRKFGSGYEISVKTPSPTITDDSAKAAGGSTRESLAGFTAGNHLASKGLESHITEAEAERMCDQVVTFMKQQFPGIELVERRQRRLTFSISSDTVALSKLFEVLQSAKQSQRVAIVEYTVQQSSLEQVFLRISEGEVAKKDDEEDANIGRVKIHLDEHEQGVMTPRSIARELNSFPSFTLPAAPGSPSQRPPPGGVTPSAHQAGRRHGDDDFLRML